ncbi:MAG: EAL domain-containing protein [Steroidobacteraceae bacterium]|jgi:diguanylate cyclase (GGDEF)-like protein
MSNPASERAPATDWSTLEPYAQLLRALLPRMSALSVFDPRGQLHWSTAISIAPEVGAAIAEAIRDPARDTSAQGVQRIVASEPLYLFWLQPDKPAEDARPFVVVAISFRHSGEAEQRTFSFVHSLIKPALECLRRELLARNEIVTLHSSLAEQDNDLELLLSVSGGSPESKPESSSDLKTIVASATLHLKVGLAALIIPERGIAILQASEEAPMDPSLLAKGHRHLLSMVQVRNGPTIVNRMVLQVAGKEVVYRVLASPIRGATHRCVGVLALFRAESAPEFTPHHARLTELLATRVASVIAHSYDALTGLLTRPAFEQRMRRALEQSRPPAPSLEPSAAANSWSALFIDINRLHVINENYGMPMGDRVITQLGELIRSRMPPGAFGSRISGDRFAILLPATLSDAGEFAEALRSGAEEIGPLLADGKMQVSISVGVAEVDARSKEFVHAFAAAETACKAANDRGRNRVEVYQEADESIVRRFTDINLITSLRAAISENRLRLNAQLIAPLGGHGGAPHFEILLRMIGDNGEIVGPDHFMSAAHRYQLMPTLDRWVISHAIGMLKPYAQYLQNSPVVFSMNFSGQSLQDAEFTEYVAQLVESSGLCASALCFELTESAAIGNLSRAEVLMRRLRKLGCNIALDDFGTGLSSLAYLRTLPIGMLKIDGSFVRDVLKDSRAESMVSVIAQLARAMSLTTVAEYVESDEIRTRIEALGVDYGQGFAIAQPVPLEDVLAELPLYLAAANPQGVWPNEPTLAKASGA